jgi:hypothetical protein
MINEKSVDFPEIRTYNNAYKLVSQAILTSKTRKTLLQILNRTIRTTKTPKLEGDLILVMIGVAVQRL